ncbi:MAG: prephenate dehydrogenase [Candidatus Omnitrophica bacterium]|nr:prephenate dehydrogenase [Candidatus Omnitrophota bacterium]MDD5653743.1 prephenate dehydrogenase [Candidatus Omnitrophota bacterium]
MPIFKRVAIVGVGLIGGSLGLAIKGKKIAGKVIGVSRHQRTINFARKIGAIDEGSLELKAVKDADLLILAAPIETILKLSGQLSKLIKKDCIVTDVASTKKEIVSKLEKVFPNFVGAHPLAGSEKRGIDFAKKGLFNGSLCIITATGNTSLKAKNKVTFLWRKLGCRISTLSASEHDRIMAFVSHLPHIIAFSLIGAVPQKYLGFSASGLRDTTRIASSDALLWAEILLSNSNCPQAIEAFEKNLKQIKIAIKNKDRQVLAHLLESARRKRETIQ